MFQFRRNVIYFTTTSSVSTCVHVIRKHFEILLFSSIGSNGKHFDLPNLQRRNKRDISIVQCTNIDQRNKNTKPYEKHKITKLSYYVQH